VLLGREDRLDPSSFGVVSGRICFRLGVPSGDLLACLLSLRTSIVDAFMLASRCLGLAEFTAGFLVLVSGCSTISVVVFLMVSLNIYPLYFETR
jgi:hypothetical protein